MFLQVMSRFLMAILTAVKAPHLPLQLAGFTSLTGAIGNTPGRSPDTRFLKQVRIISGLRTTRCMWGTTMEVFGLWIFLANCWVICTSKDVKLHDSFHLILMGLFPMPRSCGDHSRSKVMSFLLIGTLVCGQSACYREIGRAG